MSTSTTPPTQPAIDLTKAFPGDRFRMNDGSGIIFLGPKSGMYACIYDHLNSNNFIYLSRQGRDGYAEYIVSAIPDPRDEEIARLKAANSALYIESNERFQQLTAANAKVEGHDGVIDNLRTHCRAQELIIQEQRAKVEELERIRMETQNEASMQCQELSGQISQLTKERDEAFAEMKIARGEEMHADDMKRDALRDAQYWKARHDSLKGQNTAELARVLTKARRHCLDLEERQPDIAHDVFIRVMGIEKDFRWNGEGFVAKEKDTNIEDFQKAAKSNAEFFKEKDGPEQVECDAVSKFYGCKCNRVKGHSGEHFSNEKEGGTGWENKTQPDPLDAPVTKRELAQLFKGMQKAVPGNQRIRFTDIERIADKLERSTI